MSAVSCAESPANSPASSTLIDSPSMCSSAGPDALPLITSASKGIRDSSSATGPEDRESPTNPVSGDLHATAIFAEPGTPAPKKRAPGED